MIDACFIMLVLSGFSLVVQIGMSFYTLYLAKKTEHYFKKKGYCEGFLANNNAYSNGYMEGKIAGMKLFMSLDKEEGERNDD